MAKGARITLTKAQCESPTGKQLMDLIVSICHDGAIETHELESLHQFLVSCDCSLAAVAYLRAFTREMLADGTLDGAEAYKLKQAFQRVVPKSVRGIISTHLEAIGLPTQVPLDEEPAWHRDEATSRQIAYIIDLGGKTKPGMTKGTASALIEELLERRPPTPRQVMLLRFFDRTALVNTTKDEVSDWIDELFTMNPSYEAAWQQFKLETMQDADCQDADSIPVGAFRQYVKPKEVVASESGHKSGCTSVLALAVFLSLYFILR